MDIAAFISAAAEIFFFRSRFIALYRLCLMLFIKPILTRLRSNKVIKDLIFGLFFQLEKNVFSNLPYAIF